jgi:hypothetical protein
MGLLACLMIGVWDFVGLYGFIGVISREGNSPILTSQLIHFLRLDTSSMEGEVKLCQQSPSPTTSMRGN